MVEVTEEKKKIVKQKKIEKIKQTEVAEYLKRRDFSGLDLSEIVFSNLNLQGINFKGCKFKNGKKTTVFEGCDLKWAIFGDKNGVSINAQNEEIIFRPSIVEVKEVKLVNAKSPDGSRSYQTQVENLTSIPKKNDIREISGLTNIIEIDG